MVKPSVILIGVVLLIALVALLRIFRLGYSFRFSSLRKALASVGKMHFVLLILATLFGCAMFVLYFDEMQMNSSAVVSLNFAEASNGQDFDGTRYNMSEIISEDVLERAIKDGGFENVTAQQLADCLSVTPKAQGDSYNEEGYHIATEFIVQFTMDENTRHLNAKSVVQMVAQAYKSLYIERFVSTFDVLMLDKEVAFEEMEYLDAVKYLDKECSKLEYYMTAMDDENSSFRDSNGNTFSGLALRIDLLEDVQIAENLYAYIIQKGIAKDADAYVGRLEYANALLDYDRQRALTSYNICNAAIAKYDERMSRVVLVPTWDSDGEFYMGRTKIGTDTLVIKAYNYSLNAATIQKEMETNDGEIKAMSGGTERYGAEALNMILQIYDTLNQYAEDALVLVQEYSETQMNQCISISVSELSFVSSAVRSAVMAVVFYGMLVLVLVALKGKKKLAAENADRFVQ